ncbi:MAG TPA: DUF1501 domain-containing protein [Stellaceae bacterium]|jgi:uncharacterized protein (DUF1501 family)|nr:DUF1501 domain-containing protein [Stellaceae bacterium]
MTTRRDVLRLLGGGIAACTCAAAGLPSAAFADIPGNRRLVVVLQRGAMDGLAAVAPLSDPDYASLRGNLALKPPGEPDGALALTRDFALHPSLAAIHPYYGKGELLVVHATGNGYQTRSHFDAQDMMESGLSAKHGITDGWLNRALGPLQKGKDRLGLAVGGATPLILRGAVPVASYEPAGFHEAAPGFIEAVAQLYAGDTLLGPALQEGLKAQNFSDGVLAADMTGGGDAMKGGAGFGPKAFKPLCEAAGKLLAAEGGPRIAAMDMGGWDTHVGQGAESGRLAGNFQGFAEGLDALAQSLGAAWRETVVVSVTEFGRTVRVNGTNGTDHGTASLMLVMGGAIKGGRIAGDWPGLTRLQDDRDLRVATDSRGVMKAILRDHLGLDAQYLATRVFPETAPIQPLDGLLRA